MIKLFSKKISHKVGLPPGTLTYTGEKLLPTKIEHIYYDKENFNSVMIDDIRDINILDNNVNCINVVGFENIELIQTLSLHLGLHTLSLEDILNNEHPPKFEEFENSAIILLKNYADISKNGVEQNHCAIFFKDNLIVTFQEFSNPILDRKIERIKKALGKSRNKKSDYLLFVVLDAFVDTYYSYFEELRRDIEKLEEELLLEKKGNRIKDIYLLNKRLSYIRKNILPLKEAIIDLIADEIEYIDEINFKYFQDILDHTKELADYYQSFDTLVKGLIELNESNINSTANEIMKILTIVAAIFIPLSFIAGVFGMNFENMPELKWQYGYFVTLGFMAAITLGLLIFMKTKKWF